MEFHNKFHMLSNAGPSESQQDLFGKGPIANNIDNEPQPQSTQQLVKTQSHMHEKLATFSANPFASNPKSTAPESPSLVRYNRSSQGHMPHTQDFPCNQVFKPQTLLHSNKSEGTLPNLDTLDLNQNKALTIMHATVNLVPSDPRLPQTPCKQHDEFPCEHHHEEPTNLSSLPSNINPHSPQTPKPITSITSAPQQLLKSLLNTETNIHRHEPESVSEGKYSNQQSVFSSTSTHNGRSSVASEFITSDLHISVNDNRPSSPILAGNGVAGICSNIYPTTQQPRGSAVNTKSDSFSGNSDKRNGVGNGSIQSNSMVHNSDSSSNGTTGFEFHSAAMDTSNGTNESSLGTNSKSPTLLPTPSYGSGICTLVSAPGLIQSTLSLFHPTESPRKSYTTKQPSSLTSSISTRTRQRHKRGIDSNSCGDEGDKNRVLVVKRDPILQPQRTVRKKVYSKVSTENGYMQP
ncbi:hypothetical protein A4A49_34775 [Nicotiana attenuata]|uniref:Uncharacterized protein n=1 Tax=Nicotiana attenuata TaxID=49451 RepID=A0A1J6KQ83_NICAT|nr:hypothetical protein A4A49_34775 [Nicotiana attenuata]